MARITVEDCLAQIPNRFLMTVVGILRARQLLAGAKVVLKDAEKHKHVLAALRELAAGVIKVAAKNGVSGDHTSVTKVLQNVFKGINKS